LAGLTLALNNAKIIAMVGLITGIAASMSMAVSNYLDAKEENNKNPLFSGYVTGLAYIFTVITLIFPFFS
jgi:VIT1/CCC1 family predicted Fe2+/Mn2+ transporter